MMEVNQIQNLAAVVKVHNKMKQTKTKSGFHGM
jgi:hypothetical protein